MTTSSILSQAAEINRALDNHEITAAQTLLRKLMDGLQEDIRNEDKFLLYLILLYYILDI